MPDLIEIRSSDKDAPHRSGLDEIAREREPVGCSRRPTGEMPRDVVFKAR